MGKINSGEPAFPQTILNYGTTPVRGPDGTLVHPGDKGFYFGMYLRDYFAAAALTGIIAGRGNCNPEFAAKESYKFADEMLVARQQTNAEAKNG